jgi:tetratricopeptide (TPR) repeat protein
MRNRAQVWLGILLALSAHAAGAQLAVELPDVVFALPSASPPHFQKEGLPYLTESELVNDLLALIARGDYVGVLARAKEKYGAEIAALENGDPAGLVAGRAGPGRLPAAVPTNGGGISATVLYLIGASYLSVERYVPAEAALKAALAALPDYLRVHETLGLLYIRTERYGDARIHLTRAAELGLNTAGLHAALGYVNAQQENWWGVVSAYQQALTLEHDNEGWQNALLHGLSETQQYAAGLALADQMLQQEPDDPALWLYRAHMALNADQRTAALTSLETAIRLGDDSVANRQVCATLHMERGSMARAVELLRSAAAEDLEFDFIDQALARLSYEDEWDYYRELMTALDARGSVTEPQRSRLLTRRAGLQLHDGNRRAAMASLQEALELDASNADALMALGAAYQDERDYTRAELMFERASAFDLHRENALVSLAQLAIDQQNFERALALLRDVVRGNPTRTDLQRNVDVLENLVLAQTGD